jgi:hypothetical protein
MKKQRERRIQEKERHRLSDLAVDGFGSSQKLLGSFFYLWGVSR